MSNPIDITPAGIAKVLEGVTEGPWSMGYLRKWPYWVENPEKEVAYDCDEVDANFIAYARNALPLIAAHIAKLEAERDAARAEGYQTGLRLVEAAFYEGFAAGRKDGWEESDYLDAWKKSDAFAVLKGGDT
jgi:hypothetical protein